MKKIFMRIKYALGGVKSFKYLETNTTVYISCVLNEIPLHDRLVKILWIKMKMEARCDKSPRSRKMFMFCSWCRGEIPSLTLCFASSTTCLAQRPINGRPERVERTYTSRGLYPQTPSTPQIGRAHV